MNAETLKDLLAAATPGPWRILDETECHCDDDGNTISMAIGKRNNHAFALAMHPYSDRIIDANATLIALAPQLAADNIALQAEVERLRGALEQLIAGYEVWDFDPSTQKLVRLPDEKQTIWIRQARAALNET